MKQASQIALAIAVVIQVIFEVAVFRASSLHETGFWLRAVFTASLIALTLRADRSAWLVAGARILIGLNFGLAVCDRFGVFGQYGSPGVSWGDFGHFVVYTHQVNSFLPASFAPFLAVAATVCEVVLSAMLVFGIAPKAACAGAALLLLTYAVAMSVSFGFTSQLYYAVLELCAGAWFLSTMAGHQRIVRTSAYGDVLV